MQNRNTVIMAGIGLALLGVIVFMFIRMENMERRYLELASRQNPAADKKGRIDDPYIASPVKNTVVKHTGEVLACYRYFLARNRAKAEVKSIEEGPVTLDWQIDDDGRVISPGVVRSAFQDDAFHACLVEKIKTWTFPEPPYGVKKYVEHTFKFKDEKK